MQKKIEEFSKRVIHPRGHKAMLQTLRMTSLLNNIMLFFLLILFLRWLNDLLILTMKFPPFKTNHHLIIPFLAFLTSLGLRMWSWVAYSKFFYMARCWILTSIASLRVWWSCRSHYLDLKWFVWCRFSNFFYIFFSFLFLVWLTLGFICLGSVILVC